MQPYSCRSVQNVDTKKPPELSCSPQHEYIIDYQTCQYAILKKITSEHQFARDECRKVRIKDMTMAERIRKEIIRRFQQSGNGKSITLQMKNTGDTLFIQSIGDRNEEFFEIDALFNPADEQNPRMPLIFFKDSLDKLIDAVENWDKIHNDTLENIRKLKIYYEKYLKGTTQEELKRGTDLFLKIYAQTNNPDSLSDTASEEDKQTAYRILDKEVGDCKKGERLVSLADRWDFYSDWYKSVYNKRPLLNPAF